MTIQHSTQSNNNVNANPNKVKFAFKIKPPPSANQPLSENTKKVPFKLKGTVSPNKFKFKIKSETKPKNTPTYNRESQFKLFVQFCLDNGLPYFQFYDVDNWKGPATKIDQNELDERLELFDNAQDFLHTIVLNGYGFAIVKPIEHLDDSDIQYKDTYFDACKFTDEPLIPYNSDMEVDTDCESDYDATTDEEIEVEEEFVAEEWTYDRVTYLLDTSTNYLYSPSTLEFIGKKTGEFSIDFNAKER